MATQKQRSETTRSKLIAAFRQSFLKRGFEATTTELILKETGFSKGALYHHFKSKTEVMEAIYERESQKAIDHAFKSVDQAAPALIKLREACLAWLDRVRVADVSQILFEIGPAALGPRRVKQLEDQFSIVAFETLLQEASENGEASFPSSTLIANILNSLMAEVAIHEHVTGEDTKSDVARMIDAVLGTAKDA